MICDDCKHKDKCNKIISESATYCPDRSWHSADSTEWFTKDFLKDYSVVWRKYEYRVF